MQLAAIFDLTIWHLTHTNSVSLQLSMQKGMQQASPPVRTNKTRHQTMVMQPIVFLGMFPVSFPQVGQGEPDPELPLFPKLMIIGP